MSSYNTIYALREHIKQETGYNCRVGVVDTTPNEYPLFVIMPQGTDEIDVAPRATNMISKLFNVTVTLYANSTEAGVIKFCDAHDKFMTCISSFQTEKGHEIDTTHAKVYTANTIEMTVNIGIRLTYQKT